MWDVTHSYVWRDAFIRVTWLVTHSYEQRCIRCIRRCSQRRDSWLIQRVLWLMTHSYAYILFVSSALDLNCKMYFMLSVTIHVLFVTIYPLCIYLVSCRDSRLIQHVLWLMTHSYAYILFVTIYPLYMYLISCRDSRLIQRLSWINTHSYARRSAVQSASGDAATGGKSDWLENKGGPPFGGPLLKNANGAAAGGSTRVHLQIWRWHGCS